MFVCICNQVTEADIKQAFSNSGVCSLEGVLQHLGIGDCCGSCKPEAQRLASQALLKYQQANLDNSS